MYAKTAQGVDMKIQYDREVDALYIQLRELSADDSIEIEDGVNVDLDAEGHIVGVEILDVSTRLSPEELSVVSLENLIPGPATPVA